MSKQDFARSLGVSAACVSKYLATGKISAAALEGTGPRARIKVDVARQELALKLDPAQRYGGAGIKTKVAPVEGPQVVTASGGIDADLAAERLAQSRIKTREMATREAQSAGLLVSADAHRAAVAVVASRVLQALEGAVPEMAAELAERLNIPVRDAAHALRLAMRRGRASAAAGVKTEATEMDETVTVTVDGVEPA